MRDCVPQDSAAPVSCLAPAAASLKWELGAGVVVVVVVVVVGRQGSAAKGGGGGGGCQTSTSRYRYPWWHVVIDSWSESRRLTAVVQVREQHRILKYSVIVETATVSGAALSVCSVFTRGGDPSALKN